MPWHLLEQLQSLFEEIILPLGQIRRALHIYKPYLFVFQLIWMLSESSKN